MNNRSLALIVGIALLATAGLFLQFGLPMHNPSSPSATSQPLPAGVSRPARRPDFALPDLAGTVHHVREWDGQVLVINFWATWCTPCRLEIPQFNALQAQYQAQGVRFVGIALDEPGAVADFLEEIPIKYTVLVDEDAQAGIRVAQAYGNHDGILPYTVFVAADGTIATIARGRITRQTTEAYLQALL